MKQTIKILIPFFLLAIITVLYFTVTPTKPSVPSLELLGQDAGKAGEFLNAQKSVDYYRHQIEKDPDNIKSYVQLAQLFLQEARVTGKHHEYIPKADYLLEEALKRQPNNIEANSVKASVLMIKHKFGEARTILERVTAGSPDYSFALCVLTDAYVELGEYDKAVKVCDHLLSVKPDLSSFSRASYLRELHGELDGAVQAMRMASDAGLFGKENRAWTLYNLGNLYLQMGKRDTAEFIFKGIQEERPGYAYALDGLAAIDISKKEYAKAVELIAEAAREMPAHIFVEHLADLYKAMGNNEAENDMVKKAVDAFKQHEADGWNVDLEYARFCTNHNVNLDESFKRIKQEYSRRPGNVEVLDTYAWILHKMGNDKEAAVFINNALRLNSFNPNFLYHASVILKSSGDVITSEKYLSKALTASAFLNPVYMNDAQINMSSSKKLAAGF